VFLISIEQLSEANVMNYLFSLLVRYSNDIWLVPRFEEWVSQQMKVRQNVRNVLKHLHKRGTPPPKVWTIQWKLCTRTYVVFSFMIIGLTNPRLSAVSKCGIFQDSPD